MILFPIELQATATLRNPAYAQGSLLANVNLEARLFFICDQYSRSTESL